MAQRRTQQLNSREKRALARILSAAALLCLLLLALAPGCSLRSCLLVRKKNNELAEESKRLLREMVLLNEEIRLLEHDERHLEKIAREKYGLLRKDEEVYYFKPSVRGSE